MSEINGVLCDLDGTLVDTERLHLRAWTETAAHYGFPFPDGWEENYLGRPDSELAAFCTAEYADAPDAATLLKERDRRYREILRECGAGIAYPGVREGLERLSLLKAKMAVCTNSPLENTTVALSHAGIEGFFPVIVAFGMAKKGKPAPDMYLMAVERLGLVPGACLVIEDSAVGIRAGVAAGCTVLGVCNSYAADGLLEAGASRAFRTTAEALAWVADAGLK